MKYTYLLNKEKVNCQYFYDINIIDGYNEPITIQLGISKFTYGGIIDALINYKYPTDKMQAIINNYLLDPNDDSANQEFIEMQKWRSESKQIAKEILEKF